MAVAPNGDVSYEMLITEAGIADNPDSTDPMAAASATQMSKIKGVSGSGVVTDRGIIKSSEFKAPPGSDAATRQSLDQMKDAFSQVTFPQEAVGVGAKWEIKSKKKSQGMTMDQVETHEVDSIEGDVINLRTTVKQDATNQKIQSPAMPGMKVDLTKLHSDGTGTSKIDLTKVSPVSGRGDIHTETSMGMNIGGQKQMMTMKMDMHIKVETK